MALSFAYVDACMYPNIERWYMMWYYENDFKGFDDLEFDNFWQKYTGEEYNSSDDRMEAAKRKGDRDMIDYLTQLDKYLTSGVISYNSWDYPSKSQIIDAKTALRDIIDVCKRHTTGKYADRWALLQMRANLQAGNFSDNIAFWTNWKNKAHDNACTRMMRNIYANALFNTGQKNAAWEIYADQHDIQSLLWSVRKYTNLAGLKKMYAENPNSLILGYLLQKYVNNIQDVLDYVDDANNSTDDEYYGPSLERDIIDDLFYAEDAYAQIDSDYMKEIRDFVDFAYNNAHDPACAQPGLWMTASALVSYFLHDYPTAKERIDMAMDMDAPADVKKATRRIRMLIAPSVLDVMSSDFRSFIANELTWLDKDITATGNQHAMNARMRILNLGLAKSLKDAGDVYGNILLLAVYNRAYQNSTTNTYPELKEAFPDVIAKMNDDHSSESFGELYALSGDSVAGYFAYITNQENDPLITYAAHRSNYNKDYINDIIGTRYLSEGEFAKAMPYLGKVAQNYLDSQLISYYIAKRDYRRAAWNGYQPLEPDSTYYEERPTKLKGNVKIDFCKEMIDLQNSFQTAQSPGREAIAYQLASYYYQASSRGQCWFITRYGATNPVEYGDSDLFTERAGQLLREASKSTDPGIRSMAFFALAGIAPDNWCEWEYDYSKRKYVITLMPQSQQYSAYTNLLKAMSSSRNIASDISHCDILKQFRKHTGL